jgi:hypothetical protein
MTITEFLTARLDEDEEVALSAAGWDRAGRTRIPGSWSPEGIGGVTDEELRPVAYAGESGLSDSKVSHIVRHDPARVLAEVEAKRALIADADTFDRTAREYVSKGDRMNSLAARGVERGVIHALRTLALPYADHPDYDESWRP